MAEKPDEPVVAPGSDGDAVEAKKAGGGKSFLLMALPLLLISLAGGGWLAFSYYPSLVEAATVFGRDFGDAGEEEATEPIEFGFFTELQGLIVNPADSEGRRYLMVNLGLEVNKESVLEELSQKDMVVRDTVLRLLSARTVAELADISLRETIKQELMQEINRVLAEGKVQRLYFTQYVLQ
ncbi:MAG: hypothetical protein KatS3mg044_0106 [Rhodothermaceae bacterium]|nr:MAG: hypothetical protein KatS3mg044_0106 [Rhodothermaceae bacterium]